MHLFTVLLRLILLCIYFNLYYFYFYFKINTVNINYERTLNLQTLKTLAKHVYNTDEYCRVVPGTDKPGQPEIELDPDSDSDEDSSASTPPVHNQMSLDCILWSKKEAIAVKEYLDKRNLSYVKIKPEGDCFYDSILAPLNPPIINEETGERYKGNDLRLQICHHMLKNPKKCSHILKSRLEPYETSLYHFAMKMMEEHEWGEDTLLPIVYDMWGLNCTVIDVHRNEHLYHYGSKKHHSLKTADIVLIYNGSDHYSGTGKCASFLFFLKLLAMLLVFKCSLVC